MPCSPVSSSLARTHSLQTWLTPLPCALLAQSLIKAFRLASQLAVARVKELSVSLEGKPDEEKKSLLKKCAMTTLNSKLVCGLVQGWGGGCWGGRT